MIANETDLMSDEQIIKKLNNAGVKVMDVPMAFIEGKDGYIVVTIREAIDLIKQNVL